MQNSSEIRLKQQLVDRADAHLGLAGSRAGSPVALVRSCVPLESIAVKQLELHRRAKTVVRSQKWPHSDQVLL